METYININRLQLLLTSLQLFVIGLSPIAAQTGKALGGERVPLALIFS